MYTMLLPFFVIYIYIFFLISTLFIKNNENKISRLRVNRRFGFIVFPHNRIAFWLFGIMVDEIKWGIRE